MSRLARTVLSLSAFWLTCDLQAAEVLGHISDDTEPAALPAAQPQNDRQIIYRVICSPDGETLPDCERPFVDQEAVQKPIAEEPVPEVGDDMAAEEITEPAPVKKPAKTPAKIAKSTKKTAGKKTKSKNKSKASAKKTAKKGKSSKR